MQNNLAKIFFKYRSYTPIPFLLVMLVFAAPTAVTFPIGLAMVALGEFFRLWGVSWAGSETRTTGKVGGTFLIVSGPFAYVRNPLYVGNILMYCGIGVASNALFPYLLIAAFVFFATQYHLIVGEEEGFLRNHYKDEYPEFEKNVPRFIPRLTPYKYASVEQPTMSVKLGFRSETRTLQATAFVLLALAVKWYFGSK